MDWTLELHGSEVLSTEADDERQLRLRFSAALVRPTQGTSLDDEAYVKGVDLLFTQATWTGELALCVGALSDSAVAIGHQGAVLRHLALGFSATGRIRAEFNFRSGTTLAVSAGSVRCLPPDDPRFVPSYAC